MDFGPFGWIDKLSLTSHSSKKEYNLSCSRNKTMTDISFKSVLPLMTIFPNNKIDHSFANRLFSSQFYFDNLCCSRIYYFFICNLLQIYCITEFEIWVELTTFSIPFPTDGPSCCTPNRSDSFDWSCFALPSINGNCGIKPHPYISWKLAWYDCTVWHSRRENFIPSKVVTVSSCLPLLSFVFSSKSF